MFIKSIALTIVQKIKNIVWVSPLTVENSIPTEAFIELKPNGNLVQFEVFGEGKEGNKQLYSQGKLSYATRQEAELEPEYIDLENVRARCSKVMDGKDVYPRSPDIIPRFYQSFSFTFENLWRKKIAY